MSDRLTDGDLRALMEVALDEGSGACAMDGVTLGRLVRELQDIRLAINTPRVDDFFAAVRNEAAHQVERWGTEHDAGKRVEDWITLFMYLLGKAAKAHFDGNGDKLLHHVITVAAVALNMHRNLTGENTRMRPGVGP